MERLDIFYYNKWRGIELPEVAECFSHLSKEEVMNLKQGDEVWVDKEPYHLNGKVYGYTKIQFSETMNDYQKTQFFKVNSPEKLEKLVQKHGDLIFLPISGKEKEAFELFQRNWVSKLN